MKLESIPHGIVVRMARTVLILGSAFYGLPYDRYQMLRNRLATSGEHKAKVLINYAFKQEVPATFFGFRGQIAKFLTENGIRADWKYRASGFDLVDALKDENYQTVAVVGHGDTDCWLAKDGLVKAESLEEVVKNVKKKEGFWLHLTCAVSSTKTPMGSRFMRDISRVLGVCGYMGPPFNHGIKDLAPVTSFYRGEERLR